MKPFLVSLALFGLLATQVIPGWAGGDERRATVRRMGELNGVALACRYFDQTRRIKRILIDHLPKERALGQLFDEVTNETFLQFVQADRQCPSPATLSGKVDQAEKRLIEAYDPSAVDSVSH